MKGSSLLLSEGVNDSKICLKFWYSDKPRAVSSLNSFKDVPGVFPLNKIANRIIR